MNHSVKTASITLFFISTLFSGNIEKDLQTQFILAAPGDTIIIPEGIHQIRGTLSIEGKENLVIRGMGMNRSILSFSDQDIGAQGISITNCKNIILEKFTVQNSKGDAIKAQYVDGIVFRSVKKNQWRVRNLSCSMHKCAYRIFSGYWRLRCRDLCGTIK